MPNHLEMGGSGRGSRALRTYAPRQNISCYPCRVRKSRCDGEHPCGPCIKREGEAECEFAPAIRRRGKTVNSARSTALAAEKQSLAREAGQGGEAADSHILSDFRLDGDAGTAEQSLGNRGIG